MEQPDNIVSFFDLSAAQAQNKLREIADQSDKVFITKHARQRMSRRKVTYRQVICCLKHGTLDEGPYREPNGSWKMKLSCVSAGDALNVIVVLDYDNESQDHSIVVTVYRG